MSERLKTLVCNLFHRGEWLGVRDLERMGRKCHRPICCPICEELPEHTEKWFGKEEVISLKLTDEDKKIIADYGHLFNNTGGNDIIELLERKDVNYFNNPIVCELQGSCYAQLLLLKTLKRECFLL